MDVPTHDELIARIACFCERHGMAESRLGREALNSPAFVIGLRRDPPSSPTLETLNKLAAFMAEKDAELVAAEADLTDRTEAARRADDGGCGDPSSRKAA